MQSAAASNASCMHLALAIARRPPVLRAALVPRLVELLYTSPRRLTTTSSPTHASLSLLHRCAIRFALTGSAPCACTPHGLSDEPAAQRGRPLARLASASLALGGVDECPGAASERRFFSRHLAANAGLAASQCAGPFHQPAPRLGLGQQQRVQPLCGSCAAAVRLAHA